MKNSDSIQMNQCHIFSIKFHTDNIREVFELESGFVFSNELEAKSFISAMRYALNR